MRLDLALGKAAALKQPLVLGQFQPRLERHSPGAATPRLRFAGCDQRADESATAPPRGDRHARDMERIDVQAPQRRRDERAALEDAESAARRDFGCDRRAGFEKGRRMEGWFAGSAPRKPSG
jgi:hypothetical protein